MLIYEILYMLLTHIKGPHPISHFWEKGGSVKKRQIIHHYANLYKTIHAYDPILLSSLDLNMTKVHIKFHLHPCSFFRKSGTDRQKTV